MNKLGVRRSLRSLHEFSFAHQGVRILLRKNKKTRDVGLCGVPRSRAPFLHYDSERRPWRSPLQSLTQKDAWQIKKSPVGAGFADGKSFSENFKAGAIKFSVSFGQKVTEFLKILTDF